MTALTVLQGEQRCLARRHVATCDEHPAYLAGCDGCKTRNRERVRQRRKAAILGTHQAGRVPSIGAARRLQGLAVQGFGAVDLTPRFDVHREQLRRWRRPLHPLILRRTHNEIAALTSQLDGTRGPSRRARSIAHREGWHPLAAWNDIDDPDDVPQVREACHRRDPRPLIQRVLTGRAGIDVLTVNEQTLLWRQWAEQREQQSFKAGPKSFGRHFDISTDRAGRIIAAARASTDPSIPNRKVA
ncbi:hypothetical protein ACH4T9_12420 [Micromonospora sp. NPDC020750]|uniref:hypothetical protein n=1 Tax=unclassified Micromonospora TaxID=2617518 RepID=UPI00379BFF3E